MSGRSSFFSVAVTYLIPTDAASFHACPAAAELPVRGARTPYFKSKETGVAPETGNAGHSSPMMAATLQHMQIVLRIGYPPCVWSCVELWPRAMAPRRESNRRPYFHT